MGTAPRKGRADYYKPGTWNAACSMCGRKRKADEMVRNWQGLYRCPEHDEPRQPQDFARGLPDNMGVPWSQPETDILTYICSQNTISAIPDVGVPGCMIPGNPTWSPYGV
jgi:hypothetical protein